MKKNKIRSREYFEKKQLRALEKGRPSSLRIWEKIPLILKGRHDGKNNLIKIIPEKKCWESATLKAEAAAFGELCAKQWGRTQAHLDEVYKTADKLSDRIKVKSEQLKTEMDNIPQRPEETFFNTRYEGEENLTETQVRKRRNREWTQNYKKADLIYAEINEAHEALCGCISDITEANNMTRMICTRHRSHSELRRSAYWNAVMKYHPHFEAMPITPPELINDEAEIKYYIGHEQIESKVYEILERYEQMTEKFNNIYKETI